MKILAIYDNQKSADNFTVITDWISEDPSGNMMRDQFNYLGCGEGGVWFSQWGYLDRETFIKLHKRSDGEFRKRTHLGILVPFESLTGETQEHIAYRLWQ